MRLPYQHCATAAASLLLCAAAWAQTGSEATRPPAVIPLAAEPAPKLVTFAPLADALARGVAIIQFRTENVRVLPVFGQSAVAVSPHLGHLHVTVDEWPGTWAHTSADPIILVGLKPGRHKVLLEVADPSHKVITGETVVFTVPETPGAKAHSH
jgi:hypothetical protein